MDAIKNFSYGTVLTPPSPAASGTTLVLDSGQGARFPDPSTDGEYNIVIKPFREIPVPSNAEICRVTARSGDTFTITREQEGSLARTILAGDEVFLSLTKKTMDELVTKTDEQTLTNKTLTNPTINMGDSMPSTNIRAKAYLPTANQTISTGSATIVQLSAESYDDGGDFNTSTYKFVVPVTGTYLVTGQVKWSSTVTDKRYAAMIYVGTGDVAAAYDSAAQFGALFQNVAWVGKLSSGNEVSLRAFQSSGENQDVLFGEDETWLSVHLLSI